MRQKLFKKQFGAIALMVFLSLSTILIILTFFYNNYLAEEKYKTLAKTCQAVDEFVKTGQEENENYTKEALYYIMNNMSTVSECDLFVTDVNGVIRVCSCHEWSTEQSCQHTGTQISVDEIKKIAESDGNKFSTLGYYNDPQQIAAKQLDSDNGYVVAADSIDEIKALMKSIAQTYVISAIAPLILMFVAISIMTYRLTKPLRIMSEASKAMAKGDFSRRIPVTRDDEIGQLAVSFNQMTNSLARLEEVRKSFVANVSHELRTPMTTIGGFIDGIIDGTIPPENQNYYLQIVRDEVTRLSRMAETMLSISRLESKETEINAENFDFKEQLLSIVISQEQRIVQKNIEISGLDGVSEITINADKDLIYRVVYNLVDNAIKFTNDGGKITFVAKIDEGKMIFKIENTGAGIPKNELPYVFERFYKVDKSRSENKQSTGLGLYIVKTIIKKHGGTISVSSVENKFTAFEFILPLDRS